MAYHSSSTHYCSCLPLGVLSLVTVQATAVPVAKQLLPKTLGQSNLNIAAHMQHLPHMVSDAPHNHHTSWSYKARLLCSLNHICMRVCNLRYKKNPAFEDASVYRFVAGSYCCVSPSIIIVRWPCGGLVKGLEPKLINSTVSRITPIIPLYTRSVYIT